MACMLQPYKWLRIEQTASEGVRNLLLKNVIGTPGRSMVYRHCRTEEKLQHISRPVFVSLVRREKVLGTCCFCERQYNDAATYYVRYFSFISALRKSAGFRKEATEKKSELRSAIHELISGRYFSEAADSLFYAYLDPGNARSLQLAKEFGFRKAGSFASLLFSRWRPKLAEKVQRLQEEDWRFFEGELAEFYSGHRFFTMENLYYQGNYFTFREEGRIVAGLQANPEQWEVLEMPGLGGSVLMSLFPRVGTLRKLFQPDFRFVSVEGLYCVPGYENRLEQLLEHVLATFGVYSAVLCLDVRSEEYKMVKKFRLGPINRLRKEKLMDIMVKENGSVRITSGKPCYISSFDVS